MSQRTVTRWVANGHLIRVYRGVYAVGHRPANPIDRAHAALLAGGPRSVLSHATALVLWDVWHRWPPRIELTVASDRRPAGITVHHSRTLTHRDIATISGLRVTSAARTALDFAATATETQLHRAVDHLRLRHGLKLEHLDEVIHRNPTHPGKARLRRLIGTAATNPSRSGFERRWPAFARRYRLPPYETNVKLAGYEVDVLVDRKVVVELDTFETHRLNFQSDRDRDAAILAATGIPTIRVTDEQFQDQPELLATRIRSAVRRAAARSPSARAA